MALLGSPVHRILHWWASLPGAGGRKPSGVSSTSLNVSASCARMNAALEGWNGSLTAAIGFNPYTATGAAGAVLVATAVELRACFGARLASLEIANEPDIDGFSGNYSGYRDSLSVWGAALSGAGLAGILDVGVLAGSSWYGNVSEMVAFAGPAFKRFCIHTYPLSDCPGDTTPTVAALLAVRPPSNSVVNLRARAAPSPVLVGEGNSVSCGGSDGVSNVFAAALYGLDATVSSHAAGVAPYVWHGISNNESTVYYQPIRYAVADIATPGVDNFAVAPLFYGLWAAAETLTPGASFLSASVTGGNMSAGALFRVWALTDALGGQQVLLLNKAVSESVLARVQPCSPGAVASVKRLTAPSVDSRAGVAWGGQTLDGTIDGKPLGALASESVPCVGGAFSLTVPNASAVLLRTAPSALPSPSPSASPLRSPAPTPGGNRTSGGSGAAPSGGVSPSAIGAISAAVFALFCLAARMWRCGPRATPPPKPVGHASVRSRLASHRKSYMGSFHVRNPALRPTLDALPGSSRSP